MCRSSSASGRRAEEMTGSAEEISARAHDQEKICGDITKKCKKLNLYIDSKHI
jgi:hypothetical protein